jgi:thioredoxin-related protein
MRQFLLLMTLLVPTICTASALAPQPGDPTGSLPWFKSSFLDLAEDVAEAAGANKQVIVYFHQDGCPYCAKLLRDNFGQREIAERTRAEFQVVAINLWGDREMVDLAGETTTEKAFGKALRVMFTPTLLLLNTQGEVVLRINGYYPPHLFAAALDFVAGGYQRELDFREFVRRRDPPPASGTLHTEPGFLEPPLILDRPAASDSRPLLVLFEQRQCRACDELHGEALQLPDTRALLQGLRVAVVDRWSREPLVTPDGRTLPALQWAAELGIAYAPSLVFFAEDGTEMFRSEAYLRPFHMQSVLDYVVSGAWREWPEFQRYIQARADARREAGEVVELW